MTRHEMTDLLQLLVRNGTLDGLSFGYRVREAGKSGSLRELTQLELVEVSLVAEPMQPRARLHAVEPKIGGIKLAP